MMTEDEKLTPLLHEARKRGLDIVHMPKADPEVGRGWRVVKVWPHGEETVFGGPVEDAGATLDEIKAYLEAHPPKYVRRST
jgi:hypothetical protein